MRPIQFCRKYLLDDKHRLHPEDKTCALSNQWGIGSLPIINELARFFPPDKKMTCSETPEAS
jgi:hypothetical protein